MKLTLENEPNRLPHLCQDMKIGDIAINCADIFVLRTHKGWVYFDGGLDPHAEDIPCRILPKGTKIKIEV